VKFSNLQSLALLPSPLFSASLAAIANNYDIRGSGWVCMRVNCSGGASKKWNKWNKGGNFNELHKVVLLTRRQQCIQSTRTPSTFNLFQLSALFCHSMSKQFNSLIWALPQK